MPVGRTSTSLQRRKPQDDDRLGNNGKGNGKGPPATKGNPHSQPSPTPTPEDDSTASGSDEVPNATPSTSQTAPTSPTSHADSSTTSSAPVPSSADSQESTNAEMTSGGAPSQRTSTTGDRASARIDESSMHSSPSSSAPSSSPTPSNVPSSVPIPGPGPEISPGIAGALGVIVLLIIILLLLFIRSAARKRRRARAELPHAQDAFRNPGKGWTEGSLSTREIAVQPSTAHEQGNSFPTTFADDHPDNRSSFDFRSGLTTIITWPTVGTSFTNRSGRTGDQLGTQSVAETGQIVSSAESRQAERAVRSSSNADALSSHRATIESF